MAPVTALCYSIDKRCLDNINAVLGEAGMTPADVVSMQVYITDGALFDRMKTTYRA